MVMEVKVPDIGDFEDVEVIEILVAPGDDIAQDQSIISLESDKATMEVPSPAAGTVKEVKIAVGDRVSEGDLVLMLDAAADESADAATEPEQARAPQPETDAASADESSFVDVLVPDIGDFDQVDVIEVLVSAGDSVAVDQSLISLESDKATMEVPSSHTGVVQEVVVNVGDKVSEGDRIVVLNASPAPAAEAPQVTEAEKPVPAPEPAPLLAPPPAPPAAEKAPAPPPVSFDASTRRPDQVPHASPSVRKFARELGVDLTEVSGSGRKGRITREDVQAFVKGVVSRKVAGAPSAAAGTGLSLLDWPKVDFSKFGPVEVEPLSRIKKISGANLSRNWVMIPHVTQNDEADITEMEGFRKAHSEEAKAKGFKLTPLAFLIKAVVAALKEYPQFNASLDETGESLVLKQYFHVGVAVDTPDGLVVPVIRDCDKKSLYELASDVVEASVKARDRKLSPSDMQGGCFSISSLGGIGGTSFTPIINAPEVAILGVSRSSMKPVWNGQEFEPRLMLPLSLSYDHRVIDGASAARFVSYLAHVLGDIRRLLL